MKIRINIDCTPEEARTFLGLPDVVPMQEEMVAALRERIMATLRAADPETLMKTWLPAGAGGWEQMRKAFWRGTAAGDDGGRPGDD